MKKLYFSHLFIFFFLFSSIFTLQFFAVVSTTCHVDDEAGLLGFKSGINADPSMMLSSWKPGSDCCSSAGITCSDNRVTSLSLYGQPDKPNSFLSGKISPSLSKLKFVWGIYLQNLRNLSGPFPGLLFGFPELNCVYIENNKLSGQLPASIDNLTQLSALSALSLAGNCFTGWIPSSISYLTGLTQLKLGQNRLHSPIPYGICQLKNLTFLSLKQNNHFGSIPDFFQSFSNRRILELSHNKFTGKIPTSIATLEPKLAPFQIGCLKTTGGSWVQIGCGSVMWYELQIAGFVGLVEKQNRLCGSGGEDEPALWALVEKTK